MAVIKKVLNSSVVLVEHESGKEFIILSKGIGYGKKKGEIVETGTDTQMFFPCNGKEQRDLMQLMGEIPVEYLEATQEIIFLAQNQLGTKLNSHIFIALVDHIHFAAKRMEQGLVITNRVFWEIKSFYTAEYNIGLKALEIIHDRIGLSLPKDEAANIAFHIVNARNEDETGDAMRDAKLIGKIVMLVTYVTKFEPDKESINYSRFIAHLQYFVKRFFEDKMLSSDDDFLYDQVKNGYPNAMECAEKVRTLLVKEYDRFISNEEVAYLAVHIQRLTYGRAG